MPSHKCPAKRSTWRCAAERVGLSEVDGSRALAATAVHPLLLFSTFLVVTPTTPPPPPCPFISRLRLLQTQQTALVKSYSGPRIGPCGCALQGHSGWVGGKALGLACTEHNAGRVGGAPLGGRWRWRWRWRWRGGGGGGGGGGRGGSEGGLKDMLGKGRALLVGFMNKEGSWLGKREGGGESISR